MLKLQATLTPEDAGAAVLTRTDDIEVIDLPGTPIFPNVAVAESHSEVAATLYDLFRVRPMRCADLQAGQHVDAIIFAPQNLGSDLSDDSSSVVNHHLFDDALRRVREDGTRLVLWLDTSSGAEAFAKELARQKIATYGGPVGNLDAPWFGSWFFVRKHRLLDGLPVDCAMDWRYGISAFAGPAWLQETPGGNHTDGQLLDAPGMEVFIGYGADHNPRVGVSGCLIPYGKGQIVYYCLPQMVRSLQPGNGAISPVICQRLLGNALRPGR